MTKRYALIRENSDRRQFFEGIKEVEILTPDDDPKYDILMEMDDDEILDRQYYYLIEVVGDLDKFFVHHETMTRRIRNVNPIA